MAKDKYTAIWVSHSSISDFLRCPRAYYLNNVYRDPKTHHKISLMQPSLALGQAVHEVLEELSQLPVERRFSESLISRFEQVWERLSGKRGGFVNADQEQHYRQRGEEMLRRIMNHPGPLKRKAVKIRADLPYYWLSDEDNIILCGKIDWLEYLPADDSVHIIDFKTGKSEEKADSLQLSIYYLLTQNCQRRKVARASYWYLDRSDEPKSVKLPNQETAHQKVLGIAKKIKVIRQLEVYKCPQKVGCPACRPLTQIIEGKAEFVGVNEFDQDMYIISDFPADKDTSVVL